MNNKILKYSRKIKIPSEIPLLMKQNKNQEYLLKAFNLFGMKVLQTVLIAFKKILQMKQKIYSSFVHKLVG
jgi:hypothetical protein